MTPLAVYHVISYGNFRKGLFGAVKMDILIGVPIIKLVMCVGPMNDFQREAWH